MDSEPEMDSKGLCLVLTEPGPKMSEEEYHDWYDNEHVPNRLSIPTFFNAARYKASDLKTPRWLTLYDLSEPAVADGPEYQDVHANGSDRDKLMLSKIQYLTRRAYSFIPESSKIHPDVPKTAFPGKFCLVVSMQTTPEGEDEFNRWYGEEHIPMLSKVPGWLRSRRYKLFSVKERGQLVNGEECKPLQYLAIHDFSQDGYMETSEFKAATSTTWRAEIVKSIVDRELRLFELYNFKE
ncbi:hypothetical protein K435DRAFT_297102 [Dendrothele bispora CBS 962.96]|uniref:EthD domain-containing protein n=1 Tax=Dendrothele bispora (strain CBS 962.96) TaxID=1314807 RepID=A0A4S8ML03_DENBC|nr:hypothetical protein K435DRAFT_297102 [Dendrothele bispora CBS 962.96]